MHKWIVQCVGLSIVLNFCFLSPHLAQTQNKKKLKDFGSSLEKLKWDPVKKETVVEPTGNRAGDEELDVVRVETSLVAWDVLVIDRHGDTEEHREGATENQNWPSCAKVLCNDTLNKN